MTKSADLVTFAEEILNRKLHFLAVFYTKESRKLLETLEAKSQIAIDLFE